METITIEYQPNFKEKLMTFLNSFNANEVKVVNNNDEVIKDEAFLSHQKYLQETLKKIDSGETKMYSLDELDDYLENIISKYEN